MLNNNVFVNKIINVSCEKSCSIEIKSYRYYTFTCFTYYIVKINKRVCVCVLFWIFSKHKFFKNKDDAFYFVLFIFICTIEFIVILLDKHSISTLEYYLNLCWCWVIECSVPDNAGINQIKTECLRIYLLALLKNVLYLHNM